MTLYVVIGTLLALLSLALLSRPLWRGTVRGADALPANAEVDSLRQQLEQLMALNRSGTLSEEQISEARQVLERRIVDAVVDSPPPAAPARPAMSRPLLLGVAASVCALAVAGYALRGTPQVERVAVPVSASAPGSGGHEVTSAQIEAMTEALAARLKDRPDDAVGWAMLGRSFAVMGRHAQALPALKRAVTLRGDDAVLLTDYADALAVVNGGSLDGEPSRLIEQALKIDPSNLKALSLAGTHAFNRKDYTGALRHWDKVAQLAPGSDMARQIQGNIDEARKLSTVARQPK